MDNETWQNIYFDICKRSNCTFFSTTPIIIYSFISLEVKIPKFKGFDIEMKLHTPDVQNVGAASGNLAAKNYHNWKNFFNQSVSLTQYVVLSVRLFQLAS